MSTSRLLGSLALPVALGLPLRFLAVPMMEVKKKKHLCQFAYMRDA